MPFDVQVMWSFDAAGVAESHQRGEGAQDAEDRAAGPVRDEKGGLVAISYPGAPIAVPDARHWLDRVFLWRQIVDQRIDASFADHDVPEGLRVLLFNETDAGLGDAAFMHKLVAVLRAALPSVALCVVATEPDKHAVFGGHDGVLMYSFDRFGSDADDAWKTPDLVLSAPGIFNHCRSRDAVFERLGLTGDTPFQYLAEYGSIRQLRDDAFKPLIGRINAWVDGQLDLAAKAAGVGEDEVGHRASTGEIVALVDGAMKTVGSLVDDALADESSPLGAWLHDVSSTARSAGLELGELGVHCANGKAPGGVEVTDEATRAAIEEPGGVRYTGYGHGGCGVFLAMVAALEADNDKRIDVVLPNRRGAQRALDELLDDTAATVLAAEGIGRVEIIGNAVDEARLGDVGTAARELDAGGKKTIRLITRHPHPFHEFQALGRRSAPATMITGDQSFSDALAEDRAIVVIEPMYCQTWAIDAQLALAESIDPSYAAVLRFSMTAKWDAGAWPGVRETLRSGRAVAAAHAFNARIRADYALEQRVVNLVKRRLVQATGE